MKRCVMLVFFVQILCAGIGGFVAQTAWSQEQDFAVAVTPQDIHNWFFPESAESNLRRKTGQTKSAPPPEWLIIPMNYNSFDLDNAARQYLVQLAADLQQLPEVILEVAGHTDARGDDKYNLWLSYQRAHAVKKFLMTKYGITARQLIITAHGEYQPRDESNSETAYALNRRVELRIIK